MNRNKMIAGGNLVVRTYIIFKESHVVSILA